MSHADQLFIQNVQQILDNGWSNDGKSVRAKWDGNTPAHARAVFGVMNRFRPAEEFPVVTQRRTALKGGFNELVKWIMTERSSKLQDLRDLGVHWWDSWADENDTIGKAYGYQMSLEHRVEVEDGQIAWMTQLDYLRWQLANDPYSRQMIVTMWNPEDRVEMELPPCAFQTIWDVRDNELNCMLVQRSSDLLAANNINVCQYAMLQMILAAEAGLEVGDFVHVVSNLHLYDKHIELAKEVIQRPTYPGFRFQPLPQKNFFEYTWEDFVMESEYQYESTKNSIPIAT